MMQVMKKSKRSNILSIVFMENGKEMRISLQQIICLWSLAAKSVYFRKKAVFPIQVYSVDFS